MNISPSIQRIVNVLDYSLSSLYRKKLKNLSIFLVFAMVIFLFSSLQLMSRGLTEVAEEVLRWAPDITVQQMSAGRQISISADAEIKLQPIFGISKITPRIWGYYFDEANGANYTVIGLELKDMENKAVPPLATGHFPEDKKNGQVVISNPVHQSMKLGKRRNFSLFRPDLSMTSHTTTGKFSDTTSLMTADLIFMSLADARDLFAIPKSLVTDLLVHVGNPQETDTIAKKIADRLPGSRVITKNQILKTYQVIFSWRSGFGNILLISSLIAFVILAYEKASGLSSQDLREIGLLKVLGWQTTDVMAIRFWESGIIAMFAFVIGYSMAWVHIVWWHGFLFRPLLLGWSVLRPELSIVPSFSSADLLLVFAVSVLPYLCATIVPAWHSAMVRPDTVI